MVERSTSAWKDSTMSAYRPSTFASKSSGLCCWPSIAASKSSGMSESPTRVEKGCAYQVGDDAHDDQLGPEADEEDEQGQGPAPVVAKPQGLLGRMESQTE